MSVNSQTLSLSISFSLSLSRWVSLSLSLSHFLYPSLSNSLCKLSAESQVETMWYYMAPVATTVRSCFKAPSPAMFLYPSFFLSLSHSPSLDLPVLWFLCSRIYLVLINHLLICPFLYHQISIKIQPKYEGNRSSIDTLGTIFLQQRYIFKKNGL